jgi:hypothetical protein
MSVFLIHPSRLHQSACRSGEGISTTYRRGEGYTWMGRAGAIRLLPPREDYEIYIFLWEAVREGLPKPKSLR